MIDIEVIKPRRIRLVREPKSLKIRTVVISVGQLKIVLYRLEKAKDYLFNPKIRQGEKCQSDYRSTCNKVGQFQNKTL